MQRRGNVAPKYPQSVTATIRSVPSLEASESSPGSASSGFASSVGSTTSAFSAMATGHYDKPLPAIRLKSDTYHDPTTNRWSANGLRISEHSPAHDSFILSDGTDADIGHWDLTIGKAGLGKTGRVINKLVTDNEALKRDIQLERLRAEEARQAARLVEDKMDRSISEYESRLLESNVTRTLLARKERQVETLAAAVETERRKAATAEEREKSWRNELERMRAEATSQVEEAISYAQLLESQYNAISSHWRDQKDEVKRSVMRMKGDVDTIVEERLSDDQKIQTLCDLCDQQDSNIRHLRSEKEAISRLFEEYKKTQEDDLRDIRLAAQQREMEHEEMLEEFKEVLTKLKWACTYRGTI